MKYDTHTVHFLSTGCIKCPLPQWCTVGGAQWNHPSCVVTCHESLLWYWPWVHPEWQAASLMHDSSDNVTENSRGERSGDLGGQFKSRSREIRRRGNISRNFSVLIRAVCDVASSCWYHTLTYVFQNKLLCMLYVPMTLKTSPLLELLLLNIKTSSLLSRTLYIRNRYKKLRIPTVAVSSRLGNIYASDSHSAGTRFEVYSWFYSVPVGEFPDSTFMYTGIPHNS
jgi:hypothetical protein